MNPYDTTFEGYVLYNTNNNLVQHIYYRNISVFGFATAGVIPTPVPGASTHGITHITANPNNTQQVWATEGTVDNHSYTYGTRYRVQYSPDNGNTWIDISNGLPQSLPVTQIIYDEGAAALYCATDVGIYKYDFTKYHSTATFTNDDGNYENTSVSWTCFSNGLVSGQHFPNVMVGELKINHCQGKLYAATFGRSIWSTDLYPPGTVPQGNSITIQGSQTWSDSTEYIMGNIDIPAGDTLTIGPDETIFMPNEGSITVEPGGYLYVNNSLITNDCGKFWKGIQAWGVPSLPQTGANQGIVRIFNTTLANADTALRNYNAAIGDSSAGGIIEAYETRFTDCHNVLTLLPYHNWHGSALYPSLCVIDGCTFLLDNNYLGNALGYPMKNVMSLNGVEGPGIYDCFFLNRDTAAMQIRRGDGIDAVGAGFYEDGGRFSGFINGVSVAGVMGYDPTASVTSTIFDTVSVGVNVSAQSNVIVEYNDFKVGHGISVTDAKSGSFSGCYQNIGILVQNAPQFMINTNEFTGVPNTSIPNWYNFGMVVDNTGEVANLINSSTFDSLTVGVYAIGENRDYEFGGLQVYCNTFSHNGTDIYITGDGVHTADQGIQGCQCPGAAVGSTAAGNTFSGSTKNIVDDALDIWYPWYSTPENPVHVTSFDTTVYPYTAGSENQCQIHGTVIPFHGGSGGSGWGSAGSVDMSVLRSYKNSFYVYQSVYQSSLAGYNGLMDFGNTDSLIHVIDTSTSNSALNSTLLLGGPYLSEQALDTVAHLMKLQYAQMLNVLLQTSDDLRDPAFLSYVNNAYAFSSGDMAALQAAALTSTVRTTMQNTIAGAQSTAANYGNLVMMALKSPLDSNVSVTDTTGAGVCTDSTSIYYLLDSNSFYVGLDSVDQWLRNIGGLSSVYARVGYYNFMGQVSVADSILSSVSGLLPPPLSPDYSADTAEYDTYTRLWDVIKSAESGGRDIFHLDSTEIAELDTTSVPSPSYNASGMMVVNVTTIIDYGPVPVIGTPVCDIVYERRSNPNGGNTSPVVNNNGNEQFSVFPNPASGMVTFSYNAPGGGAITITVTDLLGEKVMEQHPGNTAGSIYWNPASMASGMYIYMATNANGIIGMGKIVLLGKQ